MAVPGHGFHEACGLNVAADRCLPSYMGANGGLVIVTADDRNAQLKDEQDNRYYARFAKPWNQATARNADIVRLCSSEEFDTGPAPFNNQTAGNLLLTWGRGRK